MKLGGNSSYEKNPYYTGRRPEKRKYGAACQSVCERTLTARIKAFLERFYCIAQEDDNPPLGRYEKYPAKDCALLMTAADNFFWTFEQAVSYYQFAIVNYIGFQDKGMLLAGGCGDTNGNPQIGKTGHLDRAYEFGRNLYCDI